MKIFCTATAAGLIALASPAMANEQTSQLSLGVTGGTLGVGPEAEFRVAPQLGIRANATFLGAGYTVDSNDIAYDGRLKLNSVGVMADIHPFGGAFRVSGGFRLNQNKVNLKADFTNYAPGQTVEVGGVQFYGTDVGVLSGTVKPEHRISPTLTVGYAGGITKGLKFGFEAGAMFEGSPRIRDLKASGPANSYQAFQDALEQERRDAEDDIDQYKIYPVLQLSLHYAL